MMNSIFSLVHIKNSFMEYLKSNTRVGPIDEEKEWKEFKKILLREAKEIATTSRGQ